MKHAGVQIAEITEHLFLSGRGAITSERLSMLGITHVLNVAEEIHNMTYPSDYPLICHLIAMKDNSDENILSSVDKCFDFICDAINTGGRILVHCVAGVSRSASICIMYLMKYNNLSLQEAYKPCPELSRLYLSQHWLLEVNDRV
ncbi:dual specificity protein phosphatase 14-like [Pecten maximus]|uniref:dual specificity protein phosphatase 14-like n=1 Tax=Pecten maximus TaxID=6579 RepID=UPI00145822B6|nr:dual specificity protein phosphatase 14-like [Pecten maximus]